MINKHDLAKALADNARQISTANGYELVANNTSFTPDPNTLYVTQKTLFGDDNNRGTEDNSFDLQFGIYQINIYTPKASENAEWEGMKIGGVYQAGFARGTELTYNNQMVRMMNSSLREMTSLTSASLTPAGNSATHKTHILSAKFSIIN